VFKKTQKLCKRALSIEKPLAILGWDVKVVSVLTKFSALAREKDIYRQ